MPLFFDVFLHWLGRPCFPHFSAKKGYPLQIS